MFVCLFNSDCCRNISSNTECIDICTAGRIFETTQSTCASDIDKMLACAAGMFDIDKMLACAAGMLDIDKMLTCAAGMFDIDKMLACAAGMFDINKILACAAGMFDIDKMLTCAAGMFDSWNATDTLKPTSCQEKTVYFLSE